MLAESSDKKIGVGVRLRDESRDVERKEGRGE